MIGSTVLGVVASPEDDVWSYSDYRKDKVWQALESIAAKRGINVSVVDMDPKYHIESVLAKTGDIIDMIIINNLVPNWHKPILLAHKLGRAVYKNRGACHSIIDREADRFGERLIRFIKRRLPVVAEKSI